MAILVQPTELADIALMREMYRQEMACQVIKDSIHIRRGWTNEFLLLVEGAAAGYGSVAVGGPWRGSAALYEFYVVPEQRGQAFALFEALLAASGALTIESQSNDLLTTTMLHAFGGRLKSVALLFREEMVTDLTPPAGASFRRAAPGEIRDLSPEQLPWHGVIEVEGRVVATGGILFHYNPPYGDIYMDVDAAHRRRGYGSFLVQELRRLCREGGFVAGARCGVDNVASRSTLQRAGFVPCGSLLKASVKPARVGRATIET